MTLPQYLVYFFTKLVVNYPEVVEEAVAGVAGVGAVIARTIFKGAKTVAKGAEVAVHLVRKKYPDFLVITEDDIARSEHEKAAMRADFTARPRVLFICAATLAVFFLVAYVMWTPSADEVKARQEMAACPGYPGLVHCPIYPVK